MDLFTPRCTSAVYQIRAQQTHTAFTKAVRMSDSTGSTAQVAGGAKRLSYREHQARFYRLMLAPSVILLTLITVLPVIFLILTSLPPGISPDPAH